MHSQGAHGPHTLNGFAGPSPTAARTLLTALAALCAAVVVGCGGGGGAGAGGGPDGGYVIGGRVDGLNAAGLVLRNNGVESLSVPASGRFRFVETVAQGGGYNVTVATQPAGQACTVDRGSGIATSAVDDVVVTCRAVVTPPPPPGTRAVGGSVSGLSGSGLVLQNNQADDLAVANNGSFAFATRMASGAAYAVTVATQPSGQQCSVAAGVGTVADADITSIAVSCVNTAPPPPPPQSYTVGGSITGLVGAGMVVQNNGGDSITVAAETTLFTFPSPIASGSAYDVRVAVQPRDNDCTVSQGTGTVGNANVTSVQINCGPVAPMSLLSSAPAQGATEVPRDVVPTLTFSTALDPVTVVDNGSTSLVLSDALGYDAVVANTPSVRGNVLTITPGQRLLPAARYTARASLGLRGTRGEQLERAIGRDFITADAAWGAPAAPLALGQGPVEVPGDLPAVASNRQGDAVIVWAYEDSDAALVRLRARFHRAGTGQWGDVVELQTIPFDGYIVPAPAAAVDDNGDVVVAWLQRNGAGVQVVARYRTAASGAWGAGTVVGSGAAESGPAVAAVGGGAVRLVWADEGLSSLLVVNGRMGDAAAWQAPRLVATATASWFINQRPGLQALPRGGAVMVWEEDNANIGQRGLVRALRLDDAGRAVEVRPTDLTATVGSTSAQPAVAVQVIEAVAVSPIYHVHVVWRQQGANDSRILLRRWSSVAGAWEAAPVTVASLANSDHSMGYPAVAAPSGHWSQARAASVVWREANNTGTAVVRVRAASVLPQGSPGTPVTVADQEGRYFAASLVITAPAPTATADRAGNVLVLHERPEFERLGGDVVLDSYQPRALRWHAPTSSWSVTTVDDAPSRLRSVMPRLLGASDTGSAWAVWLHTEMTEARQVRARQFD